MKSKILPLSLFLLAAAKAWGQIPPYVPQSTSTATLKAWYNLNGNGNDATSNAFHMSALTTPAPAQNRFGTANSAMQFNGTSTLYYRALFPGSTYMPSGTSAWSSMSAWVKPASTAVDPGIVQRGDRYGNSLNNETCRLQLIPGNHSALLSETNGDYVTLTSPYSGTDWAHLAVSYDGDVAYFFVNGSLVDSEPVANVTNDAAATLRIGGLNLAGSIGSYFNGLIDEVGVWDGFLGGCEVRKLYNSCSYSTIPDQTEGIGATISIQAPLSCYSYTNISYQWQGDNGSGFTNLTNGGFFSGVNTNVLTISNLTMTLNGYRFRCLINNGMCPDVTSDAMTLNVLPTAVDDAAPEAKVSLYPNPSQGIFTFNYELPDAGSILKVTDLAGQIVFTREVADRTGEMTIDLSSLADGIYSWNIFSKDIHAGRGKLSILK